MHKPDVGLWVGKGPALLVVHQLIGSYPGATAGCGSREEKLEPSRPVKFPRHRLPAPSQIPASCFLRSFLVRDIFQHC